VIPFIQEYIVILMPAAECEEKIIHSNQNDIEEKLTNSIQFMFIYVQT
jgi:hypothetical protein